MKKIKKAFTLAEVLITLGVIGVVASITLPTLIKEYNKHAWVNALKENYSLLNQGFKKMMADDGVEFISDTELWRAIVGNDCTSTDSISSDNCKDFYSQLQRYFKIIRIDTGAYDFLGSNGIEHAPYIYRYRNVSDKMSYMEKIITLSNGAMILEYNFHKNPRISSDCDAIQAAGGHMCGLAGWFSIDINGNRGPNEFGKDIFSFNITERGQLAPVGGNDYTVYNSPVLGSGVRYIDKESIEKQKARKGLNGECTYGTSGGDNHGFGCAGLLIDQLNWKMDY